MRNFTRPDELSFQAAVGWLELGNWREANEELENLAPQMRAHPEVLQVRCKVYCDAQKWDYAAEVANALCTMLPDSTFGPLHLAHALRRLDRTKEARDALLPVADKFPDEWRIAYQLACYCCRLGDRKQAWLWLERAIDVAGKVDIRLKALDEPDLEAMRVHTVKREGIDDPIRPGSASCTTREPDRPGARPAGFLSARQSPAQRSVRAGARKANSYQ